MNFTPWGCRDAKVNVRVIGFAAMNFFRVRRSPIMPTTVPAAALSVLDREHHALWR